MFGIEKIKELKKQRKQVQLRPIDKKTLRLLTENSDVVSGLLKDASAYTVVNDTYQALKDRDDYVASLQEQLITAKNDKDRKLQTEIKKEISEYKLSKNERNIMEQYSRLLDREEIAPYIGNNVFYTSASIKIDELTSRNENYNALDEKQKQLEEEKKAKQDELKIARQEKDKEQIATLQSEIKDLNKQIRDVKKDKKQKENKKLTNNEKKILESLTSTLETIDEVNEEAIVNNAISETAQYKDLLNKIAKLQNKKKLTGANAQKLQMYMDELQAINAGVTENDLAGYIANYQKWWKLNNKLETKGKLNATQNRYLTKYTKIKEQYEENFRKEMAERQDELLASQMNEGDRLENLRRNYEKSNEELLELYQSREDDIYNDLHKTGTYKTLVSQRDALQQKKEEAEKKGKKLSNANQKKLDKLNEEIEALEKGATSENLQDYITAWTYVYKNRGKVLKGNAAKKYDQYVNQLQKWQDERTDELRVIWDEYESARKEIETDFDKNVKETEADIYEKEQAMYETAKEAAENSIHNLEAMIEALEHEIDIYKNLAQLMENTSLDHIKSYEGLAEILGISDDMSVEDIISENLRKAIELSREKVKDLTEKHGMFQELIDASQEPIQMEGESEEDYNKRLEEWGNGFGKVFDKYKAQMSEDAAKEVEEMHKKIIEAIGNKETVDTFVQKVLEGVDDEDGSIAELVQKMIGAYEGDDLKGFEELVQNLQKAVEDNNGDMETLQQLINWLNTNDFSDVNDWVTEWQEGMAETRSGLVDTIEDVQALKDELRENVYFKAITNAIDQLETFRNKYNAMAGLIDDEWLIDEDGTINAMGLAKINLLAQELADVQDEAAGYLALVKKADEAWKDQDATYGSYEAYIADRNDKLQQYYDTLSDGMSIEKEIVEIGRNALEKENELLKKNIQLRIDALRKRKEMYEYSKSIANKSKEIENLKAEIDALNGVNTAEAKAIEQQKKAQLADLQDEFNDMVKEHEFDLSEAALNKFIEDLDKTLDDAMENVQKFFEDFIKDLRESLEAAKGADVNGVLKQLADIILNWGYRGTEDRQDYDMTDGVAYEFEQPATAKDIQETVTKTSEEEQGIADEQLATAKKISDATTSYTPLDEETFLNSISVLTRGTLIPIQSTLDESANYLKIIGISLRNTEELLKGIHTTVKDSPAINVTIDVQNSMDVSDTSNNTLTKLQTFQNDVYQNIRDRLYNELKAAGWKRVYS